MNKKLYAKVMTSAALLSVIALPAQAATDLTDINGSYAKDAIQELVNAGILNGKGDGKFDPTGKIERQDFAIILAKALNLEMDQAPASATFRDVPADHYAYKFVEAAAASGLINGYGNGLFGTGQDLSRQDMAVIFVRALGIDATGKGAGLTFSDASNISDYAKDAVAAAVELKLLSGGTDGNFNPTGTAERQAVAAVASNFLKKYEETKKPTEGSNTPSPGETPPAPAEPDKPVVPTTPSTPSVPSSGGNNSGGGSSPQPDTTAPMVTLESSSPITVGDPVIARSSESSTLYLIPNSYTPRTRSELESLSSGRGLVAASANINANIPTNGLSNGTYRVFAVDAAGNVSAPSSGIELVETSGVLNLSLKPGAKFWLNSGDNPSVFLPVLLTSESLNRYDYNKQNINDLIQISDGLRTLSIGEYLDENRFAVLDSSNNQVASISINTNSEELITISGDPHGEGLYLIPNPEANGQSNALLEFTLWSTSDENLVQEELSVIFDETEPTVTEATYNDGSITLTFSEDMPIEISAPNITLDYSPNGTFNDTEHFPYDTAYTVTVLNSRQFRIDLKPSAVDMLTPDGKFRIPALAPNDYAGNPIKLNGGVEVPSI